MKRYTNGSGDTNVNSTECDETTGSETAHMEPDSVCTNSVPDVAVSNVGASETKDSTEADSSEKIGEHTDNNAGMHLHQYISILLCNHQSLMWSCNGLY